MHRSGTSLLARVLAGLGAHLPDERVGPGPGNPFGHWEPARLVALNDAILDELGRGPRDPRPLPRGWRDPPRAEGFARRIAARVAEEYGDAPLLLIKDPRLCRLLPLYAEAFARLRIGARVVLCLRHPAEVTRSLAARDGTDVVNAGLLWARHVIEAEAHSRELPRVWISYDRLLGDPGGAATVIAEVLGWPPDVTPGRIAGVLTRVARPDHRHWTAGEAGEATPFVGAVWAAARAGLAGDEAAARAGFDASRATLAEFDRYQAADFDRFERPRLRWLEDTLAATRASACWRLTAPARRVADLVRRQRLGRPLSP
jgi:hypothetical protein